MSTSNLVTYPTWDIEPLVLPPRTTFYHLQPIGIGTPCVESLASYVARLAQAHQVSTVTLINHTIQQIAFKQFGSTLTGKLHARATYTLNGFGKWAKAAVPALQWMTGYDNLRPLTMLSWHQVLDQNHLLRHTRAWCPACYEQARQTQQLIYDQLLWSLAPVTHCLRHRQPLQLRCPQPDCQQALPCTSPRTQPGFCPYCHAWLGQSPLVEDKPPQTETLWSTWVIQSLAELVATAPSLTTLPSSQRLAEVFSFLATRLTDDNLSALARRFGLTSLYRFQRAACAPQLGHLLDLGYHLGLSPLQLLTQPLNELDLTQLKPPQVPSLHFYRWPNSRKAAQLASVKHALEQIVATRESPPPSKSMVARRLGYTETYLARNFPSLWHQIAECHQTYHAVKKQKLRLALEAVLTSAEEPPPSGNRVAKRLGTHRSYLLKHFPHLYAQVAKRYHDYRDAHKGSSRKHAGVTEPQRTRVT
jgi:hypothetical protein